MKYLVGTVMGAGIGFLIAAILEVDDSWWGIVPLMLGAFGGSFIAGAFRAKAGGLVFDINAALESWNEERIDLKDMWRETRHRFWRVRRVEDGAITGIRAAIGGRVGRRVMLGVGVFLIVVNVLPGYQFSGGYYYWSQGSRLALGIGAVLVVLAFVIRRKGEPF